MILVELSNAIDPNQGREIGERLIVLYDYMLSRLAEANIEQKDAPLAQVSDLLCTLLEGWTEEAQSAHR
jgi:flagellar biosynthetic protein FliS